MANFYDNYDYERGKEARQNIVAFTKYIIIAIALLILELVATGWWTILLGPITIIIIVIIAKNRNVIRGFFGLKQKINPDDKD